LPCRQIMLGEPGVAAAVASGAADSFGASGGVGKPGRCVALQAEGVLMGRPAAEQFRDAHRVVVEQRAVGVGMRIARTARAQLRGPSGVLAAGAAELVTAVASGRGTRRGGKEYRMRRGKGMLRRRG